ncbi:MAG: DUF1080 domain-containing protein [Verrucomicrobiales bacterium]|nr:DUF1080 domain-containing protein [Verrucomicrobiales bacterium]
MMPRAILLLLTALLLAPGSSTQAKGPFDYPSVEAEATLPGEGPLRRYDGLTQRWPVIREQWSQRVAQDQGAIVFLGDSITQGWGTDFKGHFSGMKLANRGIGGDTTRGMLIRLKDDVLSLNPTAVVLLLGTNDIEIGLPPEIIERNFTQILAQLKAHNPDMPIVLCRMFPSSAEKKRPRTTIDAVNALYDARVKADPQITVVDTWTLFADPAGDADPRWFKDLLHLNPAGYDRWAAALHPIFATLGYLDTDADDFQPEPGFISLFNGHDLTGWGYRPTPPRKQPKKPNPNAPVFVQITEPTPWDGQTQTADGRYRAINGRLVVTTPAEGRRIQQIWTQREFPGDFILRLEFRATPNADSGVFLRQPQLQCRDFPLAGPYTDLQHYKAQDWNQLEVTVKDNVATATCNGELLTDDLVLPETGPIGLEGDRGQMEYRRIRLKPLQE